MKFINKWFVSRKYYDGSCAYYRSELLRQQERAGSLEKKIVDITNENAELKDKIARIIPCLAILNVVLTDYIDICNMFSKVIDNELDFSKVLYRLGRITDDLKK